MKELGDASHPGRYVRSHVLPAGMSVTKAAEMIGIGRPALSNFLNGRAALSPEMAARLQRVFGVDGEDLKARQAGYDAAVRRNDQVISATTRAFVPPFLMATANDIENWSDTHRSRDQLAVLLRMLINSTCGTLELVDFPGNDDAQRRGWTAGWKPAKVIPGYPKDRPVGNLEQISGLPGRQTTNTPSVQRLPTKPKGKARRSYS